MESEGALEGLGVFRTYIYLGEGSSEPLDLWRSTTEVNQYQNGVVLVKWEVDQILKRVWAGLGWISNFWANLNWPNSTKTN